MAGQIDFGLLTTPNFLGDALRYQKAGTQQRDEERLRQARATGDIATISQIDPDEAAAAQDRTRQQAERSTRQSVLGGYEADPGASRQAAMASGDTGLIQAISGLDDGQRARAAKAAEDVASLAFSLKSTPIEQRRAAIAEPKTHEFLVQHGYTPEALAAFDPTDANLDAVIGQGSSFKDLITQHNLQVDNARADAAAAEVGRHNRATEGIGLTNAGANVTRSKKTAGKAKASAGPALPPGYVSR